MANQHSEQQHFLGHHIDLLRAYCHQSLTVCHYIVDWIGGKGEGSYRLMRLLMDQLENYVKTTLFPLKIWIFCSSVFLLVVSWRDFPFQLKMPGKGVPLVQSNLWKTNTNKIYNLNDHNITDQWMNYTDNSFVNKRIKCSSAFFSLQIFYVPRCVCLLFLAKCSLHDC